MIIDNSLSDMRSNLHAESSERELVKVCAFGIRHGQTSNRRLKHLEPLERVLVEQRERLELSPELTALVSLRLLA